MPYEDVLVHSAAPLRLSEGGTWVEGDTSPAETVGAAFDCCLFLPQGTEQGDSPRGGRQVRRPTLLTAPEDRSGAEFYLSHEDELVIVAPELGLPDVDLSDSDAVKAARRWQVDGSGQPFGKPGEDLIGYQYALVRVED